MNEVEKMYRTAKVMPSHYRCNDCLYKISAECPIRCPDNMAVYPPFTAEKQIELIKWLAIKGDFDYTVDIAKNTDAYWTMYFDDSRWTAEEFEETLAGLINNLWQDLTDAEKAQIKEILE